MCPGFRVLSLCADGGHPSVARSRGTRVHPVVELSHSFGFRPLRDRRSGAGVRFIRSASLSAFDSASGCCGRPGRGWGHDPRFGSAPALVLDGCRGAVDGPAGCCPARAGSRDAHAMERPATAAYRHGERGGRLLTTERPRRPPGPGRRSESGCPLLGCSGSSSGRPTVRCAPGR